MRTSIRGTIQAFATGLLAMTPALTGCLTHTHSVLKTRPPDVVRDATLDELLKQGDDRYNLIHTMQAHVQIVACTGGSSKGLVKCYPSFKSYIILDNPSDIRVLLLAPFTGRVLDMVSDGKTFKMLITIPLEPKCAIVGSDVVTNSAQKGLSSLRPAVILDSLLIPGLEPNQVVSMTQDSRDFENPIKRKDIIEEPDYDIEFLSQPVGHEARTLHVVHIGRITLLPWRQDIYNAEGKVATQATYDNYQQFGDIVFPTKIVIKRPLDELELTITVQKDTTFNQKLAEDEFKLDIPDGITLTNMDDPASAATAPCSAHAPQSQN